MTIEKTQTTVRLSARDWIAIVGITITVLAGVLAAFIHHDRLLMRVVTQQEMMSDRLHKIEGKLEADRR
jgi:hypothetical protein